MHITEKGVFFCMPCEALLRRGCATAKAATATTKLRLVGTRGACLISRGRAAAKAARTRAVALAAASSTSTEFAARALRANRAALQRPGGLLQGGRHDLRRQVQVLTQVLDALVSEEPAEQPQWHQPDPPPMQTGRLAVQKPMQHACICLIG
eukprot:364007-Chlamydomonas_euryale.AAC.9